MNYNKLREICYQCLIDLASEEGINASHKDEVFGCIFGRDSAITILKMLKVVSANPPFDTAPFLRICRRSLLTLVGLQGKEFNLESGEEPGKFIHEYRKEKYDHLLNGSKPWFIYLDGILRNYDSIDSTPLILIALYKYWKITKDNKFLLEVLPSVEKGLGWIMYLADRDKDFLVEYELHPDRKHGGLSVQSWTDSQESLRQIDKTFPVYPIAPVEVQGYVWLALKLWGDYFLTLDSGRAGVIKKEKVSNVSKGERLLLRRSRIAMTGNVSGKLKRHADLLKKEFNKKFIFEDGGLFFAAQALDGRKNKIKTITGNPLLLLWACFKENGKTESILDDKYVNDLVQRSFKNDLFDVGGGIRTMSAKSLTFNPRQDSYHNGSFWPKLNGLSHEGLENFGFYEEAEKLKDASLKPVLHFGTPIELYVKNGDGKYMEYCSPTGQKSCCYQAWSAACLLDLLC